MSKRKIACAKKVGIYHRVLAFLNRSYCFIFKLPVYSSNLFGYILKNLSFLLAVVCVCIKTLCACTSLKWKQRFCTQNYSVIFAYSLAFVYSLGFKIPLYKLLNKTCWQHLWIYSCDPCYLIGRKNLAKTIKMKSSINVSC